MLVTANQKKRCWHENDCVSVGYYTNILEEDQVGCSYPFGVCAGGNPIDNLQGGWVTGNSFQLACECPSKNKPQNTSRLLKW